MNHLDFVLWMILFPVTIEISYLCRSVYDINFKYEKTSDGVMTVLLVIWWGIGYLLW